MFLGVTLAAAVWLSAAPASAVVLLSYSMDEGAGTTVADSSGFGRDAAMTADLAAQPGTWVSGSTGLGGDFAVHTALTVSGNVAVVWDDVTKPLPLTDFGSFTVEADIKPTSFSANDYLFAIGETIGTTVSLRWDPTLSGNNASISSVTVLTSNGGFQSEAIALSAGNEFVSGAWQHLALVYTETGAETSQIEIFNDGVLAGSVSLLYQIVDPSPTKVHIAQTGGTPTWFNGYEGDIDNFKISAAVPEPASLALTLFGVSVIFTMARRRKV